MRIRSTWLIGALFVVGCSGGATTTSGPTRIAYPAGDSTSSAPASGTATNESSVPATTTESSRSVSSVCAEAKSVPIKEWKYTSQVPTASASAPAAAHKPVGAAGGSAQAPTKHGKYTMKDLQALEKSGNWRELLEHIEDVPPAKRDATWDTLLETAATNHLSTITAQGSAYHGLMLAEGFVMRYPALAKSKAFMAKRAEAGKIGFKERLEYERYDASACAEDMKKFLAVGPLDRDLAFGFGQIMRQSGNGQIAVYFFKAAIDGTKDSAMCSDEQLQLAASQAMLLPPDYDYAVIGREVAARGCPAVFKALVEKEVLSSHSSGTVDNLCAVWKVIGASK